MVRRKVTEIMDRFQCDEFKAINFLLQLASEEESPKIVNETNNVKLDGSRRPAMRGTGLT